MSSRCSMSRTARAPARAWTRRAFLGTGVAAGVAGACRPASDGPSAATRSPADAEALERRMEEDNIYTRMLGLRTHLPVHGHTTRLGGARMPDEVVDAMREANEFFVNIDELAVAAGARVAQLVRAEAALVTAGASGGLLLGAAACLTGTDEEKMRALPHPTWTKRECVIQKADRYPYDRAIRSAGAVFIEVEGEDAMRRAVSERTALIFGLPPHDAALGRERPTNVIPLERVIAIGKEAGVPVMIDGASRLPPASNLTVFNEMGADLVVVSGGKGLRGPQSTGILSGRADLIEAARMQSSPSDHIGRGMKVGRDEIMGLLVALERYVRLDHEAVWRDWMAKAEYIAAELQDIDGLTATVHGESSEAPYVTLEWDETVIPVTVARARTHLRQRDRHRVAMSTLFGGNRVEPRCLREGEEVLVARYLRSFFADEARRL